MSLTCGGCFKKTWKNRVYLWFYNRFNWFNRIPQWFIKHCDTEPYEWPKEREGEAER